MFSDYFCKPALAVLFNGVVQPPMIFFYNVAASLRDICDPIAESMGCYIRQISVLCKSLRLVDYNQNCDCRKTTKCDGEGNEKDEPDCESNKQNETQNQNTN